MIRMTDHCTFDIYWKVVLCGESGDLRTQGSPRYTLTEEHKDCLLKAICGENNPRCLQYFLIKSEKPSVANLKLLCAEVMSDGHLKLVFEIKTILIELLRENDIETSVYQCLMKNNCENFVLCTEKGDMIMPEELLKDNKIRKGDTSQHKPDGIKVIDCVWDVFLKKKNGAPSRIPTHEVPVLGKILKEGLNSFARQSKTKTFELYGICFEENEDCSKLVVSVNFLIEKEKILQTTIGTIEEWIFASFKQKGHENVTIFFDEESIVAREVPAKDKNTGASGTSHQPQEEIDSDQTKITKVNVSDEQADTPAIKIMDQSGKQASAGTDVDDPGQVLQEFQKLVLYIEWEWKYIDKMELSDFKMNRCREALSKSLCQTLKDEKVQGIAIDNEHDLCVKRKTLVIKFTLTNISCIPTLDQLSEVVRKCFEKNNVKYVSVQNGKEVSRIPLQASTKSFEVKLCLYVPEELTKEMKSIETTFSLKNIQSVKLIKRGTMWENSILLSEKSNTLKYKYKLKMKKSFAYLFNFTDEVVDGHERSIGRGCVQRDIFSIHKKPLDDEGKMKGIVAHVEDILQDSKYEIEATFLELDDINLRNTANFIHWNGAFGKLLDERFNEKMCLPLLYCMHKKYVTSIFSLNAASKIWAKIKNLGEESRDVCVQFVEEIFQIYEALGLHKRFPLHFINDMQSVLDISAMHRVLSSRSSYPIHDCKESISCLRKALQFVLNQDSTTDMFNDMVKLIFDYIPEHEILEGYAILNESNVSDKKICLKEMAQKYVIEKIKKILTVELSYLNFKALNAILSKVEGDFRCGLAEQCETEIIASIRKKDNFRCSPSWKDLEHLVNKQLMFQTSERQVMLLEAILTLPLCMKPRDLIRHILMHFQTKEPEFAKEALKKAYDVLLDTLHLANSSEAKLCIEEYNALYEKMFFQTIKEHVENRLHMHISKYNIRTLLKIHSDVEKLRNTTIDFYCQQLQEKLKTQTFNAKLDFLETYWNNINSRGITQVFISSLEITGVNPKSSKDDLIANAIEYVTFWTYILGAKGKHKTILEEHPMYLLMRKTFADMYADLQNDQYDYTFLQKLKGEKEKKLNDVFVLVVETSKSCIQETWKEALNFVNRACKEIELITRVCIDVSAKIPRTYHAVLDEGTQNLIKTKNKLKDGNIRFRDFKCLEIFKNGEVDFDKNLLQSCKDIEQFLPVHSFWKNTNAFFHHQMNDILEEKKEVTAELTSEKQTQLILGFLSTYCISNFKERMKRIMNDDIPISQLFHLFWQERLTEKTFSGELVNIVKVIECANFPDERKNAIIRCLDLNLNSEKIRALRKFKLNINSTIEDKWNDLIELFEQIQNNHSESRWSMLKTNSLILDMESSVINFGEEVMGVMIEYSNSKHLISFLKDIMDEDIRNLMDAVEGEYFDQYLPLVSHLVEVKEFLHPILQLPEGTDTAVYILQIEKSLQKTEIQKAAVKISECSKEIDSLKNFYKAFSNKTEKTKDRIENILKKGEFYFKMSEMECTVEILCKDGTKYTASDLSDLRSRALLIQSRFDKKLMPASSSNMAENLSLFLETVDAASEILETYQQLKMLGHPLYKKVDSNVKIGDLAETNTYLCQICDEWKNDLDEYRQKYSCLKYIKSEQLQLLFDYTKHFERVDVEENKTKKEVDIKSVLWYLHPDLELRYIDEGCVSDTPRHNLDILVHCLEDDFKNLEFRGKYFPPFIKADSSDVKFSKILNFICVDKDSGAGPNLILGWFLMKCNKLPLPSQVVLCSNNTSWDELYLLLLRSRERDNVSEKCFCIAFLELLPVEYQGMLINEIEKSDWHNSSLSLIYRGRQTDSIPTLFKDCEIYMQPFDRTQMESILQTMFPDVMVITSDSPGLGKTESIRTLSASLEKGMKSLHISGPNNKCQLIQRLKELDLKPYEILHIEIGLTDRPEELDTFLFELVILRYVSFSSLSYVLPKTFIALEIENCSNQLMVDSMPFSMCFQRKHLKWENYDNYRCQQVPNSPVQVACAYLSKLEKGDLNTDIDLSKISLMNEKKGQSLLRKYFPSFDGINFTIVNAFVSVLGNQLKKFSASAYFQNTNLGLMIGEDNTFAVRKIVIESLIQFSKEFASRSIASSRASQHRTFDNFHSPSVDIKNVMRNLALRTKGMIRWENSNHLVVVFHSQDTQTVSAVYRCLKNVPDNIKEMFESQIKNYLPDYASMESDKLLEVIVKITRTKQKQLSKEEISMLAEGYAYTPDNMLKMMMIALRIQSNIPVVVMGETGCGKTSLIRRLAHICNVHLKVLSVHAGIREKDILETVRFANNLAIGNRSEEVWLFFDELNTSEYVGLISDIVCHRELHGNALSPNLSFIAACNPYRLRESNRFTKGLKGKLSEDALSLLAYRVHPLPEMMLDFVWDYGSLPLQEERAYIQRMVESKLFKPHEIVLIQLLGASQQFVREKEGASCTVSLRDVYRCISLIKWFKHQFIPQQHPDMDETEVLLRSFIMGLTICYLCRFSNAVDRLAYRERLSAVFSSNFIDTYSEKEIARCVREEHNAILDRMDIPKGTARNTALQENIFVMLVCILNKLPLFIVGKPGCSKSLSMQLIRNNMRGKDSKDKFFQKYPRLFYSSFQGSESSTSDGIIKVFERAKKFEKQDSDVLSLVILDEIGLAEISRFNPLKVLHSLLEPEGKDRPEVAVVGISNWSLDSAKMNRAIHLSRPDMNEEELFITGRSIMESVASHRSLDSFLKDIAKAYSDYINQQPIKNFHGLRDYYSFVKYVSREFQNMKQSDCEMEFSEENKMLLLKGLLRNFGGQQMRNDTMRRTFFHRMLLQDLPICETKELIKDNIIDSEARHLMLMLDGDSALGSIEGIIENIEKDFTTILGSKFQDDENDEYNYRVLNRIILCMEQPQVLILKDLDDIYGSLYDMLNQNYTIVQGKKHCRVALGPFSNPTCEVNNDFKCIVIIDKSNIENTDPPFLNRFEKQQYLLRDILRPKNVKIAEYLEQLIHDLSSYSGTRILFSAQDSFPIAGKEMLTSLVTLVEQKLFSLYGKSTSETQVLYSCIIELLWILKPDCILRANISDAWVKCRNSLKFLIDMYMNLPIHKGLGHYLQETCATEENTFSVYTDDTNKTREDHCRLVPLELKELKDTYFSKIEDDSSAFDDLQEYREENTRDVCETDENEWHAPFAMEDNLEISDDSSDIYLEKDAYETEQTEFSRKQIHNQQIQTLRKSDGYGAKLVVFTYSTIYCKIQDALADLDYSLHKLSEYKTEKFFTKDIDHFFETSTRKWFVLQCDLKSDYHHILLAKSIIENSRKHLVRNGGIKHVCIVVHITRSTDPFHMFNKINFSTGWTLATLDSIENPIFSLPDLYNKPALDVLAANEQEFAELIVKELTWASAKIQYQGTSDNITDVLKLRKSKCALKFVSEQIQAWIRRHSDMKDNMDWQHRAACDKHLLETSATMIGTLENHLSSLIQKPLARILFSVENAGLMTCLLSFDDLKPEFKEIFIKGCESHNFYNVDGVPPPSGPGCYVINLTHNNMKVPFSKLLFENLEHYKTEVLGDVRKADIIPGDFQAVDDEKLKKTMVAIVQAYTDEIKTEAHLFDVLTFDHIVEDLRNDFCQFATSTIKCRLSGEEKADLMKWILNRLIGNNVIYDVSSFLLTLHLWTWTYSQNIMGIFHLVDSWKTRDKCNDALSSILYGSENENSMLESLQTFVDFICEDILSQCVMLQQSEMIEWQERVFKFMTIIGEIGIVSHKTETLKFFNDFVSVVFIPSKCDNTHLNQFAICVSSCNWDLNKLYVFESLWSHLKSLSKCVNALELQQVACSFIARCNYVDEGLEQKSINLKAINLNKNGEMFDKRLRFYGHCLKLGLLDYFPYGEEDFKSNLFLLMLENDIENDDLDDFLNAIHRILSKDERTSFSVLLISILEEEVFSDVIGIDKLTNIATHNDDLLQKLLQAQDTLRSQCFGMRYSAAVAYLRKFLSVTATLLFNGTYRNKFVFSTIDQLLSSGPKSKEQKHVEQFFVCCLKRGSGDLEVLKLSAELSATMQFFRTSTLLPSVENIGCSVESLNLARYCDLSDLLLLQSVIDISEDKGFLKRLVDREKTSVASLLCFLHSHHFYVECFSKVADSDRLFVESLEKMEVCLENNRVNQLIKHLVNQRGCKRNILRQSVQKSAESTSLTTFLIHVVSLILIHESKSSTLYKAAIHHEVSDCTPNERESSTSFQIRTCPCSHRIISDSLICPWCSSSEISGHSLSVCRPIKKEPFSLMVRNMLIEAALVTTCLFQDVVNELGLKEVELRERSIQYNWQKLREYLQVNDSEQCQLLVIFLENVKEIFSDSTISKGAWNPKYDDNLRNVLQNRYQQLRKDNIRHDQLCQALRSTVVVKNVEDKEEVEADHFYLTEKPSIQNLYFELHMSKSEEKFPCLNMILENLDMLQFPQYILGILQWHRVLITKCSYSLKKVDCKYMSVGSFINQQNKETQRDLRESFKIFSDKWGEIVTLIAKLEHHTTKLPYVEKITEDSKMDVCLLKDKTSTVFQVLSALCSLQNNLLDRVLAQCVLFESNALGFLHLGPKEAAVPVVALMDLQTKHIIKSMVENNEERLELFSQVGCIDDTRGTEYDFRKIEIEWGFKVFHNKAYILIDETMMFMEFKDDLYGHCVQLLQKVSALIPQADIDFSTETKIKERLNDDPSQGPQLLTLIGTITTIIVRRNMTEGRLHLAEYAGKLEGLQLIGLSKSCLLPFTEYDLTLNKVVAFYTLLEEINGEKYFTALDTEFRDAIPEKTKQQITSVVSEGITLLRACESAMHVFLHRYLYIRDNDISLQQPVADYLSSTELWKRAKILNQRIILPNLDIEILLQDVFPHELLVKHVYKFIELLKEQIRRLDMKTHIPKMSQGSRKTIKRKALAGRF